jgi:glycerophosphoryl diester phosphodiesterase
MMKQSLVVNFFCGPGGAKSKLASGLIYRLKDMGINCDLITEYAKDLSWEGNIQGLSYQPHVFGNQSYWQEQRRGKCDVIVTDSPLLLSLIYNDEKTTVIFKTFVLETFLSWKNINFYIERGDAEFEEAGRVHGKEQSKELDKKILDMLYKTNQNFGIVNRKTNLEVLVGEVMTKLGRVKDECR